MYCAKQRGRNNVQFFEAGMNAGTEERVQLESDLHEAIALKQFELLLPAQGQHATGAMRSAEALMRWMHPERGPDFAGRLHSARRGMRIDRRRSATGWCGSVPAGARLAA